MIMEEERKNNPLSEANENGQVPSGQGRRRRHKRRHGGNKEGGEGAPHPEQNVAAQQNAQKQGQPKQGGAQAQKQPQNVQKNQGKSNQNKGKQNSSKGKNDGGRDKTKGNKEDNRKDTYLYVLDGNLYVNLTNKCSNGCDFCVRNERTSYYGNNLWLRHGDPTPEKVIAATKEFGDLTRFKEVVFCGFGEPTYRVAEMLALCDFFHEKGLKTRLNTNGQGNLINKRDVVSELKGKLDFVNISLNASCYEKYQPVCRSQFGESGFDGILEFARLCRKNGVPCRFSIVDCIGEAEVEACKRLAESMKIPLYVRSYITDS